MFFFFKVTRTVHYYAVTANINCTHRHIETYPVLILTGVVEPYAHVHLDLPASLFLIAESQASLLKRAQQFLLTHPTSVSEATSGK